MCQFCVQHGEGQKWYLQAKNYSEDLLSDLRRRKFITEFFAPPKSPESDANQLERLERAPGFVRRVLRWRVSNSMKKVHFGQVLPIEDVESIFDFATSVVRVSCICRRATVGRDERYCYAVSMAPNGGRMAEIIRAVDPSYLMGPDASELEVLSKDQAVSAFREHEREGLCHSVWTFHAPFIGGVCNCDRSDCMAMRATVTHGVPVMFRAEYVAEVEPQTCNGCRACMRLCQFGAIAYSAAQEKAVIDPRRCYGCGVCRSGCAPGAIGLLPRTEVPLAHNLW
jgi:ferredoxin